MSTCSPRNTQQRRTTRFVSNFVTPDCMVSTHSCCCARPSVTFHASYRARKTVLLNRAVYNY